MARSVYEELVKQAGLGPVAGVDEAGRGACAGPLVAAAVILADEPDRQIDGLNDSKALTARVRQRLFDQILERAAAVAWATVSAAECDAGGIQWANITALRRAVWRLPVAPQFILTDGFPVDGLPGIGLGMWKADQVAESVEAASIVAKVTRDRLMVALDEQYPGYGFARHKGYSTAQHQASLTALGPSAVHRLTYANVAAVRR
ncbi:MAG: ribonuclease HII [Propionibacteriaceae bacterium]|jgi:ribonuclease HII|nr:ribonuclease HII [Propionibacteriaceae bacterium]